MEDRDPTWQAPLENVLEQGKSLFEETSQLRQSSRAQREQAARLRETTRAAIAARRQERGADPDPGSTALEPQVMESSLVEVVDVNDPHSVRVLVATDSALMGEGLRSIASKEPGFDVIGTLGFHDDLKDVVQRSAPDVLLICPRTTLDGTIERRLRDITESAPELRVVFISEPSDDRVVAIARWLASQMAYLVHDETQLLDALPRAIREVTGDYAYFSRRALEWMNRRQDGPFASLTNREFEVLAKLSHAASNRQISAELHVSVKAVERYITSIFQKMGLHTDPATDRRVAAALLYEHFERELLSAGSYQERQLPTGA